MPTSGQLFSFPTPTPHVVYFAQMEGENGNNELEGSYPVLYIPRVCTSLKTNCELSENVFIYVDIVAPNTEGGDVVIFSGLCNIKIVDECEVIIRYAQSEIPNKNPKIFLTEANQISFPADDAQDIWIDPSRSPYVYNRCDTPSIETCIVQETQETNYLTMERHINIKTQNDFHYYETIRYSPVSEDQKVIKKIAGDGQESYEYSEFDEFECGVFLSHMSEEIIHENETRAREERKFLSSETDNEALKQLMSSDMQSVSRQKKTILFLGHDSESGQTIQNIAFNDPSLECIETINVIREPDLDERNKNPRAKKYQCNKCKQIFHKISTFKKHIVGSHRISNLCDTPGSIRYSCYDCGKTFKTQEKFENHCLGHGDPDFECNKCHKVFASKTTLKIHKKIHLRKFPCGYCTRAYSCETELQSHMERLHFAFSCEQCNFKCGNYELFARHHENFHDVKKNIVGECSKNSSESDLTESILDEIMSDMSGSEEGMLKEEDVSKKADSVIAKVMSNNLFGTNKKHRRFNKTCDVCYKKFDRISDLKRHLIEHVIRSTLAKNPVNSHGVLDIRCEICQEKTFTKIDRYKAHLREHAKLTLYQCTFCDKSFSDSSNFSKHKKIHGTTYLQCDLCLRKFNSKKMISQHMEYHMSNTPVKCNLCDKVFYFKSMLNKHMKCAHAKERQVSKFRCRFCTKSFESLKFKWDHEWIVHNVRKAIVDCLLCCARFRKYSELKRHCTDIHGAVIPSAKRLLKWKKRKMFE